VFPVLIAVLGIMATMFVVLTFIRYIYRSLKMD
jgi:DMSO/TMAO reductase YedYZ heme-binding membrane subunit